MILCWPSQNGDKIQACAPYCASRNSSFSLTAPLPADLTTCYLFFLWSSPYPSPIPHITFPKFLNTYLLTHCHLFQHCSYHYICQFQWLCRSFKSIGFLLVCHMFLERVPNWISLVYSQPKFGLILTSMTIVSPGWSMLVPYWLLDVLKFSSELSIVSAPAPM